MADSAKKQRKASKQARLADKALVKARRRELRVGEKLEADAQRARDVKRSIRASERDLEKIGKRLKQAKANRKSAKKKLAKLHG